MAVQKYTISEVESLRADMVNELQLYMPGFRLAAAYVDPRSIKNPGEKLAKQMRSKVYRNTAGMAARTSTAGMFNGASPKTRPWFASLVTNPLAAKTSSVRQFIKREDDLIAETMQVNNTYRVLPMLYGDTIKFSTGAALHLPHPIYGSWLYPLAIGTYSFACDLEGNPEMFCRDFVATVKQVVDNYGQVDPKTGKTDWSNMHPYIKECYEKSLYNEKVYLTQVILPNRKWNALKQELLDPLDRKYHAYTYVQRFGTASGMYSGLSAREINRNRSEVVGDLKDFLKVTGFSYFPVIISRWQLLPEENFGSGGPTEIAMADIMTDQEMQRARLNTIDKIVRPPMVGPASLKRHQSSILAGGITYVEDSQMGIGFRPAFEINHRVAELISSQQDYREIIEEAYYVDLFKMLIGQDLKSHVSVHEIQTRASEKLQLMGPVMSQWDFDLGSKLISNNRHILREQGRLEPLPKELYQQNEKGIGNSPVRIEYISTIALAQKAANIGTIERFLGVANNIAQVTQDPLAVRIIKTDDIIRGYADDVGLDPNYLHTEIEMSNIREQAAQEQASVAQREMIAQDSEVAKNLSQAKVGEGSMLETMLTASSF